MLGLEAVFVIHSVTRFTEEIFAFLIALVFLADAFKKIYDVGPHFYYLYYFSIHFIYIMSPKSKYFDQNPVYKIEKYCDLYNQSVFNNYNNNGSIFGYYYSRTNHLNSDGRMRENKSSDSVLFSSLTSKFGLGCKRLTNLNDLDMFNGNYNNSLSTYTYYADYPQPNIALISIMLLFSTCIIALYLKKLRRSIFFGSIVSLILIFVYYYYSSIVLGS